MHSIPESPHSDNDSSSSPFRKGVPLLLGIAWNAPIAVVLIRLVVGSITLEQSNYLIIAWAAMIPIFAVASAYSVRLQKLLFKPSVDVSQHRPKLWGVAVLWAAILAFWIASDVILAE